MRYLMERAPHGIVFATKIKELFNNHTINFDGVNIGAGYTRHTYLDWFLVPTERPSIEKAPVKEHFIDIPGSNGGLDLTESLTGYPLYDFIEGDFEFNILNDRVLPILNDNCEVTKETYISWEVLNRDIRNFLNGKKLYMMLEDDPSWYYYGRFTVEKYDSSESSNSKIKINYKVYPFKKLATYDQLETVYRNTYFDTMPLTDCDTRQLFSSFWRRTSVKLYPNSPLTVIFNGENPNELPCGEEGVTVSFGVQKYSNSFIPIATYYRYDEDGDVVETISDPLVTQAGDNVQVKEVRGMILSNTVNRWDSPVTNNNIAYSDNAIRLALSYPDEFDSTKTYSKGAVVSYISYQEGLTWILIANQDMMAGDMDVTKWDVDEGAMQYEEYSQSATYAIGDIVYVKNNSNWSNKIVLVKAIEAVDRTTFDVSKWTTDVGTLSLANIYKPVSVSIMYDIGVI